MTTIRATMYLFFIFTTVYQQSNKNLRTEKEYSLFRFVSATICSFMKEEILPINLLRFFAGMSVLMVHKFDSFVEHGFLPHFLHIFSSYTQYGYLGVNLFFLISGFVITLSSEGRTLGQFISARFIRLFPVFWLCVSITTLFVMLLGSKDISLPKYLANLTMAPNVYGNYSLIDGSYWTLEVELRFYALIAILILLRSFVTLSIEKVALFMILPMVYLTFFYNPYHPNFVQSTFDFILYFFGNEYAQYFIAGIIFYAVYTKKAKIYHYIALLCCCLVAILRAFDQAYESNDMNTIAYIVISYFALFLLISLRKVTNNSFAFLGKYSRHVLVTLGAITYPL